LKRINDDKFSVAESVIFISGNWIKIYEIGAQTKRLRVCNRETNLSEIGAPGSGSRSMETDPKLANKPAFLPSIKALTTSQVYFFDLLSRFQGLVS
jgi:hypothetical protein